MPRKKKRQTKTRPAARVPVRQGIKLIEPEAVLAREIAEEDRDLRQAKVTEIFEGFREDREKRRAELKRLMNDLRMQRIRRREARQKYMLDLRQQVLQKKKLMPEVRL
ncbi:MAG: hypothetical protein WC632_06330 [Candidatus Margulisiibacteriota bacterium]